MLSGGMRERRIRERESKGRIRGEGEHCFDMYTKAWSPLSLPLSFSLFPMGLLSLSLRPNLRPSRIPSLSIYTTLIFLDLAGLETKMTLPNSNTNASLPPRLCLASRWISMISSKTLRHSMFMANMYVSCFAIY